MFESTDENRAAFDAGRDFILEWLPAIEARSNEHCKTQAEQLAFMSAMVASMLGVVASAYGFEVAANLCGKIGHGLIEGDKMLGQSAQAASDGKVH